MVWEAALLSISLIRTAERWYVQRGSEAFPVDGELPSTAELLTNGVGAVRAAASATAGGVPADRLALLSPVTTPCRVVAQAVNYPSHAQDAGVGEDPPPVFFRKSSASVSAPTGEVLRPGHVRLLDYELEVGLVMGHRLPIGAAVTDADLPGYVAAVVMCNDVSARDVQLEKASSTRASPIRPSPRPVPGWSCWTQRTSTGWAGCGCGCG
jgi:2-keto-4-pentenoate hydratase/2-oxohepta-3-ene-1,7-dioic acid hydratase in catechol pathway